MSTRLSGKQGFGKATPHVCNCELGSHVTLDSLFYDATEKHRVNAAVVYDEGLSVCRLTYNDVLLGAQQISAVLVELDVENTVIGLIGSVNECIPALIIGILQASAAFTVLNPQMPHIHKFVESQKIKYIISEDIRTVTSLKINTMEKIKIKLSTRTFSILETKTLPSKQILLKNWKIAYIIQTSGTTGVPKTLKVPHRCIVPNIIDFRRIFNLDQSDVVLMAAPLTFDPSIVEIFAALTSGASLLIISEIIKATPQKLVDVCLKHSVTFLQGTPSLIRRINKETLKTSIFGPSSCLHFVVFGGEPCPKRQMIREWQHDDNKTEFYNVYGITEVSSWATLGRVKDESDVALGEPLTDTELEVRGDNGEVISEGEGQLFVGGKNRICLLDDEDVSILSTTVFRGTGDFVRRTKDGDLYYLGRRDDQVKRFGKKLFIRTVEEAASNVCKPFPCVCVYDAGSQKLWLFFADPSSSISRESVYESLRHVLPDYAVPDNVVNIPNLPVTPHGKLDKTSLLRHVQQGAIGPSPQDKVDITSLKCLFKEEWMRVLKVDSVLETDSFMQCGGSSVSAVYFAQYVTLLAGKDFPLFLEKLLHNDFGSVWKYVENCILFLSGENVNKRLFKNELSGEKEVLDSAKKQRTDVRTKNSFLVLSRGQQFVCKSSKTKKRLESLQLVWKYDLKKCIDASPLVVSPDGSAKSAIVYIGSHSYIFAAVRAETGERLWETKLGGRIESSAASSVCEKYVVVGCYDHNIYCLDCANGEVRWKFPTGAEVKCSPLIIEERNLVVVGGHDHCVYALELKTGNCLWKTKPSVGSIFSSPCYSDDVKLVYIATLDGSVTALSPENGKIKWQRHYGKPIFSSPSSCEDGFCFGVVDGFLYSLDHYGNERWKFDTGGPVFSSPCMYKDGRGNNIVCCGSHSNLLHCCRFTDGVLLWKCDLESPVYSTPFLVIHVEEDGILSRGLVIAASTEGRLYVLCTETGDIQASYKLPGEVFSSPVCIENCLVIGCRDDNIYSFRLTATS